MPVSVGAEMGAMCNGIWFVIEAMVFYVGTKR